MSDKPGPGCLAVVVFCALFWLGVAALVVLL